jgi:hypothetical protein
MEKYSMTKYLALLAGAALLVSTGVVSAQSRNYDSSGAPKSAPSQQRSGGGLATGNTTGAGGKSDTTGSSSSTKAGQQNSGAPTVDKGSGNSSLPEGSRR